MRNIPDLHKLKKSRTAEMSSKELNERLKAEVERSEKLAASGKKVSAAQSRKQKKISEQTRRQLPPQSPARKRREQALRKQEEEERRMHKRRRRGGNYIIYYVMLGLLAFFVFTILSVTVLFNTEYIVVAGESVYTDEEIIAASELEGNENLVTLNTSGIPEKILNKLVMLDSVKVDKVFPSTIRITVEKSVAMANFYYGGRNYVISHIGRVMQIDGVPADCMTVIGYDPSETIILGSFLKASDPAQDEMIARISDAIERSGLTGINTVDITDNLDIVLSYEDRIMIHIGSDLELDQKMKIARELIYGRYIGETEHVTLDISNPSRARQRAVTTVPPLTAPETSDDVVTDEDGNIITPEETDTTVGNI